MRTRRIVSTGGSSKGQERPYEYEPTPEDQVILDALEGYRQRIISDRANGSVPEMPVIFGEWVYIPAADDNSSYLLLGPEGSAGVHYGEPVADPPEWGRVKSMHLLENVAPVLYERIKRYYDKRDGLA